MSWSFRIARIAGIDLTIHLTFLLMLPLGAMLFGGSGLSGALFGILMIVLLFGSVLLHELGHALTARALGIPVSEIQLMPFGGVAILSRPVLNPGHELLIAIMGPLVNVLIIIALAILAIATGLAGRLSPETALSAISSPGFDGAVLWLIQANVLLALFNMIPAFPLDGGRVTRAVLACAMPYRRATLIAGVIGQIMAVLLGIWGLTSFNLLLIATAVFIFFAARQEVAATDIIGALGRLRVADAMSPQPAVVYVGQRARDALDLMAATGLRAVLVLQGERPIGVVLRHDAQMAVATGRGDLWVTMVMRRQYATVQLSESLEVARMTLAEENMPVLAVFEGETFRGLLTMEDIAAVFNGRDQGGLPPARSKATPSA